LLATLLCLLLRYDVRAFEGSSLQRGNYTQRLSAPKPPRDSPALRLWLFSGDSTVAVLEASAGETVKRLILISLAVFALPLYSCRFAPAQTPPAATVPDPKLLNAIERANHLLTVSEQAWIPKAYCYNCHHESLKFRVDRLASEHGVTFDRKLANENLRVTQGIKTKDALGNLDYAVQGTYFVDAPIVDGIQLTAAHDLGVPKNLYMAAFARRVEKLQRPEGYWVVSDRRPPQSESYFSATAYAIEAIRDYLPERIAAERDAVIARAKAWLLKAEPRGTEDEVMTLFGLKSAGATPGEIAPIAKRLLSEQRADGGWAQLPTRTSDAYATGQSLVALNEVGALPTTDAAYRHGVDFLLKTQAEDGSWHVETRLLAPVNLSPPPFDFKLPYDDDYIISYFGTAWASQALMLTLPRVPQPEPIYNAAEDDAALFPQAPQPDNAWIETALFGTTEELKSLLDKDLSANAVTPGGTPLLQLVATDVQKTKLVLARGADVNAHTRNGYTALTVAANYRGTTEVVRVLLEHRAKIERREKDAKGNTDTTVPLPLFLAAGTGEVEKARLLVEHGDPVDGTWTRPGGKYTPLINAIDMGDAAMADYLLSAGADIHGRDGRGLDPLSRAVLSNYTDVATVLIARGADVNAPDGAGYTPLQYAARLDYGNAEIVKLLFAAGARPGGKDPDGRTALEEAEYFHHELLAAAIRDRQGE
jgi:ankyrin repeat protein